MGQDQGQDRRDFLLSHTVWDSSKMPINDHRSASWLYFDMLISSWAGMFFISLLLLKNAEHKQMHTRLAMNKTLFYKDIQIRNVRDMTNG